MKYQPNQIYRTDSDLVGSTYFIVTRVERAFIVLRNLANNRLTLPSTNSIFLDFCTYIGTADSHPELLI